MIETIQIKPSRAIFLLWALRFSYWRSSNSTFLTASDVKNISFSNSAPEPLRSALFSPASPPLYKIYKKDPKSRHRPASASIKIYSFPMSKSLPSSRAAHVSSSRSSALLYLTLTVQKYTMFFFCHRKNYISTISLSEKIVRVGGGCSQGLRDIMNDLLDLVMESCALVQGRPCGHPVNRPNRKFQVFVSIKRRTTPFTRSRKIVRLWRDRSAYLNQTLGENAIPGQPLKHYFKNVSLSFPFFFFSFS